MGAGFFPLTEIGTMLTPEAEMLQTYVGIPCSCYLNPTPTANNNNRAKRDSLANT